MGSAVAACSAWSCCCSKMELHVQRVMPVYYLIVSLMLIPVIMSTIAIKKPSVAGFACVVFLSTTIYHVGDASPYTYALNRMLDTALGIVVALIVNLAMPGRSPRRSRRWRTWTVPALSSPRPRRKSFLPRI